MTEENKKDRPLYPCPCCSSLTLYERGAYEMCVVCGWEDDLVQSNDPAYSGGANSNSLSEAQANWRTGFEQLMRESVQELGALISDRDRVGMVGHLDHAEYGVAYDLLTFILDKCGVLRPKVLQEAGRKMGLID